MSLSVHWDLYLPKTAAAGGVLEELRSYLEMQNFYYVGPLVHRSGEEADFRNLAHGEPDRYAMIIARRLLFMGRGPKPDVNYIQDVLPLEVYALLTSPGAGAEAAVFALGRYPAKVVNLASGEEVPTGCGEGWWGHGFCNARGVAHARLFKALDFLAARGALAGVNDEIGMESEILDPEHAVVVAG